MSYVGAIPTAAGNPAGGGNVTSTLPVGWEPGHVALVAAVAKGTDTVLAATGWTEVGAATRTSGHRLRVFRRVLEVGDTGITVTTSVAGALLIGGGVWSDIDQTTPEDVAAGENTAAAQLSAGSIEVEPITDGATVVAFASTADDNALDLTASGAWTEVFAVDTTVGTDASLACAFRTVDPAAPSGTVTWTQTVNGAANWNLVTIALRPASVEEPDPPAADEPGSIAELVQAVPDPDHGIIVTPVDVPFQMRFVAEVAVPLAPDGDVWDGGAVWDDGTLWGGPGVWVDITPDVRGVTWSEGIEMPGDRPRVPVATIQLANPDGKYSAWAATGPFVVAGRTTFRAGVLIRFGFRPVDDDEVWRPRFTGTIESCPEGDAEGVDAWVDVTAVGTLADLAAFDGPELAPSGAGENVEQRTLRLLEDAGWRFGFSYGYGYNPPPTVTSTTMAGNRLAECYLTADSAGWVFMQWPDGTATITERPQYTYPPDVEYSNDPGPAELPLLAAHVYSSTDRILNYAVGARVDGAVQIAQDAGSVGTYGRRGNVNGWPRYDLLCETDAQVLELCEAEVERWAWDDEGIDRITVDVDHRVAGSGDANRFSTLAYMRLFDQIQVRWVHPGGGEATHVLIVEGMTHQFTPEGPSARWVVELLTSRRQEVS